MKTLPSISAARATFATMRTRSLMQRVFWCKGVTSLAMCSGGIFGRRAIASQHVHAEGNRFQMCRIHASAIPTQMIQREPGRNRSNQLGIRPAMGQPVRFDGGIELAVPSPLAAGQPNPAWSQIGTPLWKRAVFVDARPEAVRQGLCRRSLALIRAMVGAEPLVRVGCLNDELNGASFTLTDNLRSHAVPPFRGRDWLEARSVLLAPSRLVHCTALS